MYSVVMLHCVAVVDRNFATVLAVCCLLFVLVRFILIYISKIIAAQICVVVIIEICSTTIRVLHCLVLESSKRRRNSEARSLVWVSTLCPFQCIDTVGLATGRTSDL